MKNAFIVILCVVITALAIFTWAMREITLRDNTIAILNYHLSQLRQPQPQVQAVATPEKK